MSDIFIPDSAGIQEIALGPEVMAAVKAIADAGKEIAEAMSQDFRVTGEYASSFEVDTDIRRDVGAHERAQATLRNTSGHAAAVEWGYEGRSGAPSTSAHHVLARTLNALSKG